MPTPTSVKFNDYQLDNIDPRIVETLFHDSAPSREISIYKIARRDGEKLVASYFERKTISLKGYIQKDTTANLELAIDELKKMVHLEGNLDIEYAGGTRRYRAIMSELAIEREPDHLDWCPYSITFIVPEGKGKDIIQTIVDYGSLNSSPYSGEFNNLGSAEARPKIYIGGTGAGEIQIIDSSARYLKILNKEANKFVRIDYDKWSVEEADTEEGEGTPIPYEGVFTEWLAGINFFTIVFAGTITVKFKYFKEFL